MSTITTKRGYSQVPTVDPDSFGSSSNYGASANPDPHHYHDPVLKKKKGKTTPKNLRPGLFYQFGDRGKFAANNTSVALANRSESEHEGERIELVDFKPRRAKLKKGKLKSPKTVGYSRNKTVVLEEPILPGDTVQRVALRYGCRVSALIILFVSASGQASWISSDSEVVSLGGYKIYGRIVSVTWRSYSGLIRCGPLHMI